MAAHTAGSEPGAAPPRPIEVCLVGLIAGGHSGVPRYAAALSRALDRVSDVYPDLSLTLLTTAAGADAVDARSLAVKVVAGRSRRVNTGPGRLALEHLSLRAERADLLHFFDVTGPVLAPRRPFVATVHDAAVMQGFGLLRNTYKLRLYPWALARARALVAVSQFAKDETLRYFDVDPEKIVVVHSGPGFVAAADGRPGGAGDGDRPFLVRAFDRADVPARLLLAGRARGGLAETTDAIAAARSRDRIEILSDVSDAELDRLYRSALAVVLPSSYEGFGFTSLEAMSRGCPVLASDIAALREISGSGALLLPLGDEEAWAHAIRRVVSDEALRAELRARGDATVRRYSWDETARGVLEVFRRVVRRPYERVRAPAA